MRDGPLRVTSLSTISITETRLSNLSLALKVIKKAAVLVFLSTPWNLRKTWIYSVRVKLQFVKLRVKADDSHKRRHKRRKSCYEKCFSDSSIVSKYVMSWLSRLSLFYFQVFSFQVFSLCFFRIWSHDLERQENFLKDKTYKFVAGTHSFLVKEHSYRKCSSIT